MIRIEHLAAPHLSAVASLHRQVFRSRTTAEELEWKYFAHQTGADHGCFVAMEGEAAVAFHGGLPQIFELEGRTVLVGQSCDSMAAPSLRGSGVYAELVKRTEDHLMGQGFELIYGAANESSRKAVLRMGWRPVGAVMSRFTRHVETVPLLRLGFRVAPLRRALAAWVQRGFAMHQTPLEGFVNSQRRPEHLVHRYSNALFRYKSRQQGFAIRIGDVRGWLKASPDLVIGDLFAPDSDSLKVFLDRLSERSRRCGVAAIHCFAFPGAVLDVQLAELGARQAGHHILVSPGTPPELAERLRVGLADFDTF